MELLIENKFRSFVNAACGKLLGVHFASAGWVYSGLRMGLQMLVPGGEWVRRVLREAVGYSFPTGDMAQMNAEIEKGYSDSSSWIRTFRCSWRAGRIRTRLTRRWTWDTSSNGKGELSSLAYGDTTIYSDSYDVLGRVTGHRQVTAGESYPFAYEYYRNDALKKMTYPSGRVVNYGVDNAGRPSTAAGVNAGATTNYVSASAYMPHGELRQLDLGGANTLRARWGSYNGRLQLEQMTVSKLSSPAASLMELGWTYNGSAKNGSPDSHTISDGAATRTHRFVYDAANRVSSVCEANVGSSSCSITSGSGTWTGNGFGQAYGYDSYNNRWIYPNGTVPILIFQPTSSSAYDASTNRFSATNFGGTFDGAGQRVESKYTHSGAANTNTMVYDGLGRRVKKLNPGFGDTYYVYDTFGNLAAEYGA
jgi:hypothetical protein